MIQPKKACPEGLRIRVRLRWISIILGFACSSARGTPDSRPTSLDKYNPLGFSDSTYRVFRYPLKSQFVPFGAPCDYREGWEPYLILVPKD